MKTRGFTLVELLVVISIISFLSSIVLASLNIARAKGRDSFRVQSLNELQTALELYYHDYGNYPDASAGWVNGCGNANFGSNPNLMNLVSGGYIKQLPTDPTNYNASSDSCYTYEYTTSITIADWVGSCGGTSIVNVGGTIPYRVSGGKNVKNYKYAIRFETEKGGLNLPLFSLQRSYSLGSREYCLLGPSR